MKPIPVRNIGIFGRQGSGKSYLLARMVKSHPHAVIVLDPCGEHESLGTAFKTMKGFKAHWFKNYYDPKSRIVLSATALGGTDVMSLGAGEFLMPYLETVLKYAQNSLIVIDEVDAFADAIARDKRVEAISNYGRKLGLSLMFAARRPPCVPRTLTSQCHELRIFKMHEPRDLMYFESIIGKANAERLPTLQEYHHLLWNIDGSTSIIGPEGKPYAPKAQTVDAAQEPGPPKRSHKRRDAGR